MMRIGLATMLAVSVAGCGPSFGPAAINGVVFYCPGIGNFDLGDVRVREGLEAAGFKGQVATFYWTIAPGPAAPIDQIAKFAPRLRAGQLADYIEDYIDRFPDGPISIVGLSAGTGVALWALEDLSPGYMVDNVVLLSSSLSSTFNAGKAAQRVHGKIYCYYSSNDIVLTGPMRLTGTIDGAFIGDAAGVVGLRSPRGQDKIVNLPWRAEYARYGYYGGHTDSTSAAFVRAELADKLMGPAERPGAGLRRGAGTRPAPGSPGARPGRAASQPAR